jgi:hypothetical protein
MTETYRATIPYESLDPLTIGASGDDEKVTRDTLELELPAANLLAAVYPSEPDPVGNATEAARKGGGGSCHRGYRFAGDGASPRGETMSPAAPKPNRQASRRGREPQEGRQLSREASRPAR